ncbi:MAG: aminoacyl-tRNA hydrolase [Acidimicrobiia bacterium]|nr:aminoacyl-tRNA hydrolase [Acidimicrobiia bacterium]
MGLRNPGPDYHGTRHNVGEVVVRALADRASFKRAPRRIAAEIAEVDLGGRTTVIALPTTFMNESGGPVSSLVSYFKVRLSSVVLVHDDIDLPFGKLRFHAGRGAGGHNGVASVMRSLGSREVWRMKVGVGRPPGRQEPADFVLERFPRRQHDDVTLMVGAAVDVVRCFATDGGEAAQQAAGDATARLGIAGDAEP